MKTIKFNLVYENERIECELSEKDFQIMLEQRPDTDYEFVD